MFESLEEIKKLHVRWQIMAVLTVFGSVLIWLGVLSLYFNYTGQSYQDVTSNFIRILWVAGLLALIYFSRKLGTIVMGKNLLCGNCHKRIFTGQRPEVAVTVGVCPYCNTALVADSESGGQDEAVSDKN